jgi:hypothetical protein
VVNVCKDSVPSLLIKKDQCAIIDNLTRQQWESKYWSMYWVGRITGSTFKQAISAELEKPPYSLIKNILYHLQSSAVSRLTLVIHFVLCLFSTWFYKLSILKIEFLNRRNLKRNPLCCKRPYKRESKTSK